MKKSSLFFGVLFFSLISLKVDAQTQSSGNYFVGKWNVLVEGTPNGDSKMIISLERKDSILTGAIQDSTGKEIAKVSNVEEKDNSAVLYFTAEGYDVNLRMEKKDEDHVTGSMMDMFDAKGDRIKETVTK